MTEIDFDELDKAVNALIKNDTVAPEKKSDEPVEKTLEIKPTSAPIIKPVERTTLGTRPLPVIPVMAPPLKPQNTPRPKGRFMDMVPKAPAPKPAPIEEVIEVEKPEVINEIQVPSVVPEKVSDDIIEQKIEDKLFEAVNSVEEPAIDSPFLANTKIEKRPLGAFSDTVLPPTTPNEEINFGLQEELSRELLSVESDENVIVEEQLPEPVAEPVEEELAAEPEAIIEPEIVVEEVVEQPVIVEEPAVETEKPIEEIAPVSETLETSEIPETPVVPVAEVIPEISEQKPAEPESVSNLMGSIQQQYQETPVTGEPVNGSIYDTNSYHQAIPTQLKNNPKLTWTVWIALLLLVGAGTGALMYFFVLPLIG